jgi:hypothetical protein
VRRSAEARTQFRHQYFPIPSPSSIRTLEFEANVRPVATLGGWHPAAIRAARRRARLFRSATPAFRDALHSSWLRHRAGVPAAMLDQAIGPNVIKDCRRHGRVHGQARIQDSGRLPRNPPRSRDGPLPSSVQSSSTIAAGTIRRKSTGARSRGLSERFLTSYQERTRMLNVKC